MRTIWKYEFTNSDFNLQIPIGAKFLKLDIESQQALWFEIPDTNAPKETRSFVGFGTGWEMPNTNLEYLGTVFKVPFVFHFYEDKGR